MSVLFLKKIREFRMPEPIAKHFPEKVFPDSNMTEAQLADFHKDAIRAVVKQAYDHSPFYRKKMDDAGVAPDDIKGPDDLRKLPFLTKNELLGKPWALLACDKKDISLVQVSTGTTGGEEIYVMYTWEDFYLHELSAGYPKLLPIEQDDICFHALPYEMSAAGLALHKVFMEGCQATVVPAGKGGAYSNPVKTVKLLKDLQPTIVITSPSWAVNVWETAVQQGFDLTTLPLKRMWLTGEGCSDEFRKRVEKLWGTKANFYYGSLECGGIGVECDVHNGYHLNHAHSYVEIIDSVTGEPLEPGEIREIVATCLMRYHTPVLRYRTRDLGYIDPDPCPCGVPLPRLFLRGRLVDQIYIQGISFSPYYLEEFLMKHPEVGNWYEFVVDPDGSDRLKIRCELAEGVEPSELLVDSLASSMEFSIGIPCEFEFVDKLPRPSGKTIRVVHA